MTHLRDLRKLITYFILTAIVAFFRIPLLFLGAGKESFSPTSLVLYTKDLKLVIFPISALKFVAASLK